MAKPMMEPRLLANGNIEVPARATAPGIIGDGVVELKPSDDDYAMWLKYINSKDTKEPQAE